MREKKGQAMEFFMTYGWAILVVLVAVGALAYFGVLDPKNRYDICTNLVVEKDGTDNVYPTLNNTGYNLLRDTHTDSIFYIVEDAEPKSDDKMFQESGLVFCHVPVELCLTSLYGDGVSICQDWSFTIPVIRTEFSEWYEGVV